MSVMSHKEDKYTVSEKFEEKYTKENCQMTLRKVCSYPNILTKKIRTRKASNTDTFHAV